MGQLRVIGQRGDTKVEWDPSNEVETEAARKHFRRLVDKNGFKAFGVVQAGQKGDGIEEFDPKLAQIIMVPPMAGGA